MNILDGKVALVSGSGRGIGKAIALKLASAGAHVVVNDLDEDVAKATASEIESLGVRAVVCVGDVTDADFGDKFVGAAVAHFGTIDIIVNNAGYAWDSVLQKTSDEQWMAMLDVHLRQNFLLFSPADYLPTLQANSRFKDTPRQTRNRHH